MVWGDSHANSWAPALDRLFEWKCLNQNQQIQEEEKLGISRPKQSADQTAPQRAKLRIKVETLLKKVYKTNQEFQKSNLKSGLVTFAMVVFVNEVTEASSTGGMVPLNMKKRHKREILVAAPKAPPVALVALQIFARPVSSLKMTAG